MANFYPGEFSWRDYLFRGKNILPEIRHQGFEPTCVFNALCTTAEIELARAAALGSPPQDMRTRLDVDSFIRDYEYISGAPMGKDCMDRLKIAFDLFRRDGVLARGDGDRVQIYDVRSINKDFDYVCGLIDDARPVFGLFKVSDNYNYLKPMEIYEYDPLLSIGIRHAVVFVGYGQHNGRGYLVYMNSYGTTFGQDGFGRLYFDYVEDLMTM